MSKYALVERATGRVIKKGELIMYYYSNSSKKEEDVFVRVASRDSILVEIPYDTQRQLYITRYLDHQIIEVPDE